MIWGFSLPQKKLKKLPSPFRLFQPLKADTKAGENPVEARPATSMSRRVPEKPRDPDALENEVLLAFTGGGNAHDLCMIYMICFGFLWPVSNFIFMIYIWGLQDLYGLYGIPVITCQISNAYVFWMFSVKGDFKKNQGQYIAGNDWFPGYHQKWYCWCLKSGVHQLRWVVYPIIYRVLYIPGGAAFIPSTVPCTHAKLCKLMWKSPECFLGPRHSNTATYNPPRKRGSRTPNSSSKHLPFSKVILAFRESACQSSCSKPNQNWNAKVKISGNKCFILLTQNNYNRNLYP